LLFSLFFLPFQLQCRQRVRRPTQHQSPPSI
jgi:hypothetical protein